MSLSITFDTEWNNYQKKTYLPEKRTYWITKSATSLYKLQDYVNTSYL